MSLRVMLAAAAIGVALSSGSAVAYERHFDFGEVWKQAVDVHQRDDALSASPRDVMRRYPRHVFQGRPHDPSGNIILEGAQ
ncbi:hypothetical protein WOC76_01755 [Methylocystis sp. IM3]|uniref:hypothetical protein n=1 Tax=unclassified Methylocystis TaxID=2625913 RepID=UPI000FA6AFF4|nr:MAG: hypothetical protein EKK29_14655 [Hyphomicrobiales bacterium]